MRRPMLFLAFLAACSGSPSPDPPPPPAASSTAAPSVSSVPVSVPSSSSLPAVPFEVEVKQAALALLELRNDVFQHPDVARVADYIAPTCTCLERERGFIERFVNEDLHWTAPVIQVRGIELSVEDPTEPLLTVVAAQPAADLIDDSGSSQEHVDAFDEAVYRLTLLRSASGGWLLNGFEAISLDAEAIAMVLGEGTP